MARENRWDIDLLDVLSAVVFETQGASRIAALRLFSIICRYFIVKYSNLKDLNYCFTALSVNTSKIFFDFFRANKEFMRERLNFFIELTQREGFFDNDDGALAAEFFNAVAMLGSTPNINDVNSLYEPPFRLPETHRILQCVHAVLVQSKSFSFPRNLVGVANISYNWYNISYII